VDILAILIAPVEAGDERNVGDVLGEWFERLGQLEGMKARGVLDAPLVLDLVGLEASDEVRGVDMPLPRKEAAPDDAVGELDDGEFLPRLRRLGGKPVGGGKRREEGESEQRPLGAEERSAREVHGWLAGGWIGRGASVPEMSIPGIPARAPRASGWASTGPISANRRRGSTRLSPPRASGGGGVHRGGGLPVRLARRA